MQGVGCGLQGAWGMRVTDGGPVALGLWAASCEVHGAGCRLRPAACSPTAHGCGLWDVGWAAGCRMCAVGCGLWAMGCGLQDAGCRVQAVGCGVRGAGCGLWTLGCRLQAASCELRAEGCGQMNVSGRMVGCGCRHMLQPPALRCGVRGAGCGVQGAGCGVRGGVLPKRQRPNSRGRYLAAGLNVGDRVTGSKFEGREDDRELPEDTDVPNNNNNNSRRHGCPYQ